MSDEARFRALLSYFLERAPLILEDLEALVIRESPSDDPSRVSELSRFVVERLVESGVPAELVPMKGRGDAVRASLGGASGGTLLVGHLDTVWPAGTLQEIPFRVEGGVATGPGVFDMKGGIAVGLSVLSAFASGAAELRKGVGLFLTPDEEVGSEASRELLIEEAKRRDQVLVLEPSGDGGAAKVARKGIGLLDVRFNGIAAHAGLEPEKGASALSELARFVLFAEALGDPALGTSVVSTVAHAGTKTNVVPEKAKASVDFRVWSASEAERLMAAFSAYRTLDTRVGFELTGGLNRPPMEQTPQSRALFGRAASIAKHLGMDLREARVGGASDGNLTAAAGVPTLDGLGPRGGGAHARSEHLEVDDLPWRAALVAALIEEISL